MLIFPLKLYCHSILHTSQDIPTERPTKELKLLHLTSTSFADNNNDDRAAQATDHIAAWACTCCRFLLQQLAAVLVATKCHRHRRRANRKKAFGKCGALLLPTVGGGGWRPVAPPRRFLPLRNLDCTPTLMHDGDGKAKARMNLAQSALPWFTISEAES